MCCSEGDQSFSRHLACSKCDIVICDIAVNVYIEKAVEQEDTLYDEVEIVRKSTHLSDRVHMADAGSCDRLSLGCVLNCCMEDFLKS